MTSPTDKTLSSGVMYSLLASALFASMYYYTSFLQPLGSEEVYGWRILLTAPCLMLVVIATSRWPEVSGIWLRFRRERWLWVWLLFSSVLLGVQLWLFMWAPMNGHALDVSLGYFMLPLTLVLTGRLVFKESVTRLQKMACGLAAIGVANELYMAAEVSWPTFLVCLGYPIYFSLRRIFGTDSLGGMWIDMAISLPVSLYFVFKGGVLVDVATDNLLLCLATFGLGVISACALAFLVMASTRLNLTLFGLFSYVEPVLLVGVAFLLGETISADQWLTYIAIWTAISLLILEGVLQVMQRRT